MASFRVHPVVKLGKQTHPVLPLNVRQRRVYVPPYKPDPLVKNIYDFIPANSMARKSLTKTKKKSKRSRKGGRIKKFIPRALASRTKLIRVKATNYNNLAGTGTIAMNTAQLNSVDDPFTTVSGGQPLGFDQWKALYKKAIVIGSKVNIKFHNRGTSAVMVGVYPAPLNQGTTALTDYEYYMEAPNNKALLLSPEMDHTIMIHKAGTKKHLSRKDVRDDSRLQLDLITETPPTDLAYWHIYAQAVDQSSAYAVDAVITIDYLVLLIDPIIPARSVET